jgi:hypothetical protein
VIFSNFIEIFSLGKLNLFLDNWGKLVEFSQFFGLVRLIPLFGTGIGDFVVLGGALALAVKVVGSSIVLS